MCGAGHPPLAQAQCIPLTFCAADGNDDDDDDYCGGRWPAHTVFFREYNKYSNSCGSAKYDEVRRACVRVMLPLLLIHTQTHSCTVSCVQLVIALTHTNAHVQWAQAAARISHDVDVCLCSVFQCCGCCVFSAVCICMCNWFSESVKIAWARLVCAVW